MGTLFATVVWLSALWPLSQGRRALRGTTLIGAWWWGVAGALLWTAATFSSWSIPAGIADQLWYAGSLLWLAALVAILGAKRPSHHNWMWFVVLPVLAVLGWPAGFAWSQGWPPLELHLTTPAAGAYVVVCIMGLGNYVGTRLFPASLLLGGALLAQLIPLSSWHTTLGGADSTWRHLALALSGLAILWTAWCVPWRDARLVPWDRAWVDFVNQFGIVWGRRLQERFNDMSRRSRWGIAIDFYGLHWPLADETKQVPEEPPIAPPVWEPRYTEHFRWLLSRFVDDAWLAERGIEPPAASAPPAEDL